MACNPQSPDARMKLGAFAPQAAFLPALARLWLESDEAAHEGLIILPSRRAAQALAGAFLEASRRSIARAILRGFSSAGALSRASSILFISTGDDLPRAVSKRTGHPGRRLSIHRFRSSFGFLRKGDNRDKHALPQPTR